MTPVINTTFEVLFKKSVLKAMYLRCWSFHQQTDNGILFCSPGPGSEARVSPQLRQRADSGGRVRRPQASRTAEDLAAAVFRNGSVGHHRHV